MSVDTQEGRRILKAHRAGRLEAWAKWAYENGEAMLSEIEEMTLARQAWENKAHDLQSEIEQLRANWNSARACLARGNNLVARTYPEYNRKACHACKSAPGEPCDTRCRGRQRTT